MVCCVVFSTILLGSTKRVVCAETRLIVADKCSSACCKLKALKQHPNRGEHCLSAYWAAGIAALSSLLVLWLNFRKASKRLQDKSMHEGLVR